MDFLRHLFCFFQTTQKRIDIQASAGIVLTRIVVMKIDYINEVKSIKHIPISVDVRSTEGERIVDQGRIDHHATFSPMQQVRQVEEMTVASSHSITGTVLVQHKDLTRRKPAL